MGESKEPLSVGEFTRWAGIVTDDLKAIRDGQDDHGQRLARIESRQEERDRLELLAALKPKTVAKRLHLTATTWTTGITSVVGALAAILYRLGWYPSWMEKLVKP